MEPSILITVLSVMALAGTLTIAAWRTFNRPAGGDRFEEALQKITGGSDLSAEDMSITSSGKKFNFNWNSFWLDTVEKAGRQVKDPGAPGRAMLGVAAIAMFYGVAVYPGGSNGVFAPLVALGAVYVWLGFEKGKRKGALEKQLPLLLSSLRTQMNAGVTIQGAIIGVADELPSPLGDEIRQVKADVSVSVPLEQSLENLASRVESRLFHFLVSSIGIALRSGSDLVPQLITIEEIVRQRSRIQGKIRSALALAKPTAYLAMAAPPGMAAYLFLTKPEYPAYFFGIGFPFFGLCVLLYGAGIFTIRIMISNVDKV